jgi:hypothetical protein
MLKTLGVTGKAIAEQSVYGIGDPLKNTEDFTVHLKNGLKSMGTSFKKLRR